MTTAEYLQTRSSASARDRATSKIERVARVARTEPSLTEWAVLGLLREAPRTAGTSHAPSSRRARSAASGRSAAARLSRDHRPPRSRLRGRPRQRPSATGPQRMLLAPTPRGRQALRRWLARPTHHVRDLRSELLIKLLLLERSGSDETPLLRAQLELLEKGELALAAQVGETRGVRSHRRRLAPLDRPRRRARSSRPCSTSASASRSTTRRSATSAPPTPRSTACPCSRRPTTPARPGSSSPSRIRGASQDLDELLPRLGARASARVRRLGRDGRPVPRRPAAGDVREPLAAPAQPDLAVALHARRRRGGRARRRRPRPARRHAGARPEALRAALRHPGRARSPPAGSPTGPS